MHLIVHHQPFYAQLESDILCTTGTNGNDMPLPQTQPAEHSSDDHNLQRLSHSTEAEVVDLTSDSAGGPEATQDAAAADSVSCPVCSKAWATGSISNLQLNEHIDQCLFL